MAVNTIGDTTSFSGSDITVVAYRGFDDPTTRLKLAELAKKRKELVVEANDLNRQAFELSKEQAGAQQNAELQRQILVSDASINPGGGFSSGNNNSGSFQNYRNFTNRANELSRELDQARTSREALLTELDNVSAQEKELSNIPYMTLGTAHTISYSSFREKFAVRTLGRTQAKTYTRGPRTIAGTMVFNTVQELELLRLLGDPKVGALDDTSTIHPNAVMIDQIQPFNLMFLFANEFGSYSAMHLFNIDLSSEGQEMSIDNIVTHNTMNFYATDMIPMRSLGSNWENYDQMINGEVGFGLNEEANISKALGLRYKSKLEGKSKSEQMQAFLSQSRGLF